MNTANWAFAAATLSLFATPAFAESGINLELGVWCADPENGLLSLRSAVNLQIWHRFAKAGIAMPFPQREVRTLNPSSAGS